VTDRLPRSATASFHTPLFDRLFGSAIQQDAVRVLSLDGGGIRGIISATVVVELVKRTGLPIEKLFDHIAGTSTGSILACGWAAPDPDHPTKARWSAQEGFDNYVNSANSAMAVEGLRGHAHAANLFSPKFYNHGLNEALRSGIGDCFLSETVIDITVPAYEIGTRSAFLFSTRDAKADLAHDFRLWEVARASCAAPTLYEPHLIKNRIDEQFVMVDGGFIANNPAMAVFADIERRGESRDMVIVSIGTGAANRDFDWPEIRDWGVAQWARPMLRLLLDSSSQAIDFELRHVLGKNRYRRFQTSIPPESESLDDVSVQNIDRLVELGTELIASSDAQLDEVCALLVR
jgi:uncharacterized protein